MEAPDGPDVGSVLDRTGDFSPCLLRSPIPRRLGFVLCCKEPAQDRRERLSPKTTDKRFPLDHLRQPHPSPYVRPPRAFRWDHDAGGAEGGGSNRVEKVQGVEIARLYSLS